MSKFKYIEIVSVKTSKDEIVKRIDVTGYGERSLLKIDTGININLNQLDYFTRTIDSETELLVGDIK